MDADTHTHSFLLFVRHRNSHPGSTVPAISIPAIHTGQGVPVSLADRVGSVQETGARGCGSGRASSGVEDWRGESVSRRSYRCAQVPFRLSGAPICPVDRRGGDRTTRNSWVYPPPEHGEEEKGLEMVDIRSMDLVLASAEKKGQTLSVFRSALLQCWHLNGWVDWCMKQEPNQLWKR